MEERKVVPFPRKPDYELSSELLSEKIIAGEAEYLGSYRRPNGEICEYYRLLENGEVTFIFNVRPPGEED